MGLGQFYSSHHCQAHSLALSLHYAASLTWQQLEPDTASLLCLLSTDSNARRVMNHVHCHRLQPGILSV